MSYKIVLTDYFKRQTKTLYKKYPSLKNDIEGLISSLEINPIQGTPIGKKCYKIRLAIASKGKGKSGGARIISHVDIILYNVVLLTIYDKSEQETITSQQLNNLLKDIL